jgi:hypothetical protein
VKCVELIDSPKNGLFSLLDEECLFPKGTDSSYCEKLNKVKKKDQRVFLFLSHPSLYSNAIRIRTSRSSSRPEVDRIFQSLVLYVERERERERERKREREREREKNEERREKKEKRRDRQRLCFSLSCLLLFLLLSFSPSLASL